MKNISSRLYYLFEKKVGIQFNPFSSPNIFLEFDEKLYWKIAELLENANPIKVLRTSIKDQINNSIEKY